MSGSLTDSEARQKARSQIDNSHAVEAAAGTGKTTILVDRVVNLLLDGTPPERIAAITFTEQAAVELKERVREEVGKLVSTSDRRKRCVIQRCFEQLDSMQISTIHSFCASILRQRPIEARVDPDFRVADELEASLIFEEVWEEWLTEQLKRCDKTIETLLLLGVGLQKIRKIADHIREHRDLLDYLPNQQPTQDYLKKLKAAIELATKEAPSNYDLLDLWDRIALFDPIKQCSEFENQVFIWLKHRESTSKKGGKRKGKQSSLLPGFPDEASLVNDQNIVEVIAHNTVARLTDRLKELIDWYQQAKERRGVLDFHDLLLLTRDMLKQNPSIRKEFKEIYRQILIDEFQDTDPLQVEIALLLCSNPNPTQARSKSQHCYELDAGKIFVVGDPKQSIYRFRRADIEMYKAAMLKFPKDCQLVIHNSFRSVPTIVDFVNSIFGEVFRSNQSPYQAKYVEMVCARGIKTFPNQRGVRLIYPPNGNQWKSTEERREAEAQKIADFISKSVEKQTFQVWDKKIGQLRPIQLGDIVILLRSRTGLEQIKDALDEFDVKYRVVDDKDFYVASEVEDLIALLRSIDDPCDKMALIRALKSPFFSISDDDLFLYRDRLDDYLGDAKGTPLEQPFALLKELHDERNRVPFDCILEKIFTKTNANITYLLRSQGERCSANFEKISQIGRALEERGIRTFGEIVRYLHKMQLREAEESEATPWELEDDSVKIMTFHAAKGLEFPMVILFDLASGCKSSEVFIVDRGIEGQTISTAVKLHKELGLYTTNWQELLGKEKERITAEMVRLLYVAMTRARDYLVLPCYWMSASEATKDGKPNAGSLLHLLKDVIPSNPDDVCDKPWANCVTIDLEAVQTHKTRAPEPSPETEHPLEQPKRLDFFTSEEEGYKAWLECINQKMLSRRKITAATDVLDSLQEIHRQEIYMKTHEMPVKSSETSPLLLGLAVHELLHELDWTSASIDEDFASAVLKELGCDHQTANKAVETVRRTLRSDLISRILRSSAYFKEVPFCYSENGDLFEGRIDVVFVEPDGISIVDFKTGDLSENEIDEACQHYSKQMEIYAKAIEKSTRKKPKEIIIFFTTLQREVRIPPPGVT